MREPQMLCTQMCALYTKRLGWVPLPPSTSPVLVYVHGSWRTKRRGPALSRTHGASSCSPLRTRPAVRTCMMILCVSRSRGVLPRRPDRAVGGRSGSTGPASWPPTGSAMRVRRVLTGDGLLRAAPPPRVAAPGTLARGRGLGGSEVNC